MLTKTLGSELPILSQKYVEELVRVHFPHAQINDIVPFFKRVENANLVRVPGVVYVGFLRTAMAPRLGNDQAAQPPVANFIDSNFLYGLTPFFTMFDALVGDTGMWEFIGWKVMLDGGLESPEIADPPPADNIPLQDILFGKLAYLDEGHALNHAAEKYTQYIVKGNSFLELLGSYLDDVYTTLMEYTPGTSAYDFNGSNGLDADTNQEISMSAMDDDENKIGTNIVLQILEGWGLPFTMESGNSLIIDEDNTRLRIRQYDASDAPLGSESVVVRNELPIGYSATNPATEYIEVYIAHLFGSEWIEYPEPVYISISVIED